MEEISKDTFGLKVSNSELTAVELSYSKKGVKVEHFAQVKLEPGIVENDHLIMNHEAFQQALKNLLETGKIKSRNVIISIPERKVFSHYIDIPSEKINDFDFILGAARDFIPIDLSDATADYKIIEGASSGKTKKIHFVAVQENFAQSIMEALMKLNLKVVAVDVSNSALIRACHNRFMKNEEGFMIINIEQESAMINVISASGISTSMHSKVTGETFINKVKDKQKITRTEEALSLITEKKDESLKNVLEKEYGDVLWKANELVKSMKNEENINIKTIYLVGPYAMAPGLREVFQSAFEGVNITEELEYVNFDKESPAKHIRAIGLALRAVLPGEIYKDINLLPFKKKSEVESERIAPGVKRTAAIVTFFFAGLLIFSGIFTAERKLALDLINQQGKLIFEKANNPELTSIARQNQQETQIESQINAILSDSIPSGAFMSMINDLNTEGINLMNVNYSISQEKDPIVQLQAHSPTREATQRFISKLEENPYFIEVNSPLSNLAGKGERTIEMSMMLDSRLIINDFLGEIIDGNEEEEEITEEETGNTFNLNL